MTEFLRQLWEPIAKLPRSQQIGLAVILVLVVVGILTATFWGTRKDYTPLFEEPLKVEDAAAIVTKLQELNIQYELGATTTDIRVPLAEKSYVLLQLAQEKSLPKAKAGWQALIDERSIFSGTTQQEFELNFVRGLQTELETALVRMGPIKEASVSIVRPKREIFKDDQQEPTASVLLELVPGAEITSDQIRAIRDWICSAVEGLKPDNVRIADTLARDLTRLLDDEDSMTLDKVETVQLKFTRKRENYLKSELQSQLERVFGYGKAVVRVRLDMDYDKKEAVSDVVIPLDGKNTGIVLSEKLENEEYMGRDLVEDGEPGINSNVPPGAPAYPGTENTTWNKYNRNAHIRNYEVTRSKEKYVKEQGTIRRLTVSIILDGNAETLSSIEDNITRIAENTVGYNKERGDKLALMVIPFVNDDARRAKEAFELKQQQEKQMFMIIVGLLMSFPVFLGIVYVFVRVSRARALMREQAKLQELEAEAKAIRSSKEEELERQREQQWKDWERRFSNIRNFFPEIKNIDEKKKMVRDLRREAMKYAFENDMMHPEFEEMTPEEQFIYREAFKKKAEGTLEDELRRLEQVASDEEIARKKELAGLGKAAETQMELEEKIKNLIESKPEDAVQVLRLWLGE